MQEVRGIAAVEGIAVGRPLEFVHDSVNDGYIHGPVTQERERFLAAVEATRTQIAQMAEADPVFEFHLEMTCDPELHSLVIDAIDGGVPAPSAVDKACRTIVEMFSEIDDEYLRERRTDVGDVCLRIRNNLLGCTSRHSSIVDSEGILIARTLLPSDLMSVPLQNIRAIVTSDGSTTSHICIIAGKHSIPVVVGVGEGIDAIMRSSKVIVDGNRGIVLLDPDEDDVRRCLDSALCGGSGRDLNASDSHVSLKDANGRNIRIEANADSAEDIERAIGMGAEGIGVFRSEFLYMSQPSFPSEQCQTDYYEAAARACAPYPLTIRTLDVGGDKNIPYISFDKELNPFMGLRGIRYSLAYPVAFRTQLRALLRASVYGNIRIMFPMITTVSELRQAKSLLEECKSELRSEGIPFDGNVKVGTMIETPASVISASSLAQECDFFSIGTNDLFQYVMAADRTNPNVAYLLDVNDSPVLEAIRSTILAADKAGIECAMCGEMASREEYAGLLLRLGLRVFSVRIPTLSRIRLAVSQAE